MDDTINGTQLGPRVTAVTPTDDYSLILTFTGGEKRIFNAVPLLEMAVFRPLKNKALFQSVKVSRGSVLWPQDIDYCPDTLYMESIPVNLASAIAN